LYPVVLLVLIATVDVPNENPPVRPGSAGVIVTSFGAVLNEISEVISCSTVKVSTIPYATIGSNMKYEAKRNVDIITEATTAFTVGLPCKNLCI
jgi:hypothetical protein